jgi:TonB-linked SusC/RagA family outer membrane protein
MKIMQIHNSLFQKYRFFGVLLLCIFITGTIRAQEAAEKKANKISLSLNVTDESGTPIPKAKVMVGDGILYSQTDENGTITLNVLNDDVITISSNGYEKNVSPVNEIIKGNTIKLIKSKLFMTSDDVVPLPFMPVKKRYLSGSSTVIYGSQLDKYPSTDLRNALSGLATGVEVREQNGSPGLSVEEKLLNYRVTEKVGITARGRNMMVLVDDMPVDITEMPLDPDEVGSITVIKDVIGKAMYGPSAADGILYIKTKRGIKNQHVLNVNIEDGVNVVDRMPEWVSGADYATLNNQARIADGLTGNYSASDITAYAKNDPYDLYHPSINYRDMMLKNSMAFRRANVSSSGGNDMVQYRTYLGYDGEGDLYKIGAKADYTRIVNRSNIDIKINNFFKIQFDFYGGLTYRRSPNYGYSSNSGESGAAMDIIEMSSVMPQITSTPSVAFPVYANNDPELKANWYGVSSLYPSNPIGNLVDNGYYSERGRASAANVALDYDLGSLVKGLKSKTYVGFNIDNVVRIGKSTNYIAYIATPGLNSLGKDTITLAKVHDGVDASGESKLHDYYYQRVAAYENLSYEKRSGNNFLQASATFYISQITRDGYENRTRTKNGILTALYSYKDKYSLTGVLNYAGSASFEAGKRYKLFPSIGAGWVVSEESFMSNMKFINYLKVRAEAGILGYDNDLAPFRYRDNYNRNTSGAPFGPISISGTRWFGTDRDVFGYRTTPGRIGNPNLGWQTRKEFSAGFDALMLNQKLSLEVTYYNNLHDGVLTTVTNTTPYIAGISSTLPIVNYNKIRYYGVETGLQFTEYSGELKYSFGGNVTVQNSSVEKYDEPNYRYNYQSMIGKPIDAIFGQTYLGKFASDAEALTVPQIYDVVLHAGDLKYQDMNNDGIVDDNDRSMVGHTTPRLFYAINAKFSFKKFDLTVIGTGRALYDLALTNNYFWNGWGDNNYSKFVKDNIGGAYPKLSYYKVNNNFVNSDFWLTDGGFFKIQNVELAYNLPEMIGIRAIRLYVRGANLLTFSKVKDVDPESVDSGVTTYPLFRTFTGGIKLTF